MASPLTWLADLDQRVHHTHCSLEAEVAPNVAKRLVRHLKHVAEAAYYFRLALTRAATTREQQVPDWMVQVAAKSADTNDLLAKIGPALEEAAAAGNDPRVLVIGPLDQYRLDLLTLHVAGRDLADRVIEFLAEAVHPPGAGQCTAITDFVRGIENQSGQLMHLAAFMEGTPAVIWLATSFTVYRNAAAAHGPAEFQRMDLIDGCVALSMSDPERLERVRVRVSKPRSRFVLILPDLAQVADAPVPVCHFLSRNLHRLRQPERGQAEDLVKRVGVVSAPLEDIAARMAELVVAVLDMASRLAGPSRAT